MIFGHFQAFFAIVTPLLRGILVPKISNKNYFFTLRSLEGTSPCVQGIFWDLNTLKLVKVDHFLKNVKKRAILGHFVRVHPYKKSVKYKTRYHRRLTLLQP